MKGASVEGGYSKPPSREAYFGGKSSVASLVWDRLGDVPNYVEPFFGSGAALLSRPHYPFPDGENRIETVNDLDGFISNFWRALRDNPDAVAEHADWIVDECSLHARHLWLVNEGRQHVERLKTEPDYHDAKIAGWWVWGISQWIGGGWCGPRGRKADGGIQERRPHLGNAGMGVHRPSRKRPHLGNAGIGVHRTTNGSLRDYFSALSARLRRVRVCCGDWSRICGPAPTVGRWLTGVFLDPPYLQTERDAELYAVETNVSVAVREWCLENGDNKLFRIALCGYAGEGHEELEQHGWECVAWKTQGGYANLGDGETTNGRDNARRERIWFSPYCIQEDTLFARMEEADTHE